MFPPAGLTVGTARMARGTGCGLRAAARAGGSTGRGVKGVDTNDGWGQIGPTDAEQAARMVDVEAAVIAAGPLLTRDEVTAVLHGVDPSRIPDLIALPMDDGARHYPAFQFDADAGQVRPIVLQVNGEALLDARHAPWPVASWWTQPDGRLPGGRSPASLLGTEDEPRVLRIAQADVLDWE